MADTDGSAGPHWKKSSRSAENGNCVEVAELPNRTIGVRDSKDNAPSRLVLTFSARPRPPKVIAYVNSRKEL
jgi:Domain of unknown function (DUF397)